MYTPVQTSRLPPAMGTFEEFIDSIVMNDEFVQDGEDRPVPVNGNTTATGQVGPTNQQSSGRSSGESAGPGVNMGRSSMNDATLEAREADADRMQKLRQRNRDAQARHRKRQRARIQAKFYILLCSFEFSCPSVACGVISAYCAAAGTAGGPCAELAQSATGSSES